MEPLRILDHEGRLHGEPPLDDQQALEALRLMLLSRSLDERAIKLQRLGRLGTYGPVHGQEASVVGSAMALDPSRDWIRPAYREQAGSYERATAERVHGMYADRCPVYRSLKAAIAITTELVFEPTS